MIWASAVGSVVPGPGCAHAGRWRSWRRYSVLPLGLWMVCMLPLQFRSLLPLTVAVYGAAVATFAVALLAEPVSRQP